MSHQSAIKNVAMRMVTSSIQVYDTYPPQIISLPQNLLIVDYLLGHTGSVHDAWAFQSTCTFKNHGAIFGPGEWMWADLAYPPEMWSVAPFKKPVNGQLTADQMS